MTIGDLHCHEDVTTKLQLQYIGPTRLILSLLHHNLPTWIHSNAVADRNRPHHEGQQCDVKIYLDTVPATAEAGNW